MKSLLNYFKLPASAVVSDACHALSLEVLEERQMLSTVSIFAQGTFPGQESFEVTANGTSIAVVTNVPPELTEYQFGLPDGTDADDIRIEFLNDRFDPSRGIDQNLTIDKIQIGNRVYETEDAAVFSTGTWTAADGVQDGFGRGDTLHVNGFFQYSENGFSGFTDVTEVTEVTIDARGFGDSVDFELQLDGQRVQGYSLSARAGQSAGVFDFTFNGSISADRIRIAFTNDLQFVDPISGSNIDRNLLINSVTIGGEVFQGSDGDVFSTGTFLNADGVQDGFGRGNTLHANGFFQFADRSGATTDITVDATAVGLNVDVVIFEIRVDNVSVGEFAISPNRTNIFDRVATVTVDGTVDPSQVSIVFVNDFFGSDFDRNLRINSLTIGDTSFDPADSSVFSTGTWRAEDGVRPGFGRGNILHSNGSFQFA